MKNHLFVGGPWHGRVEPLEGPAACFKVAVPQEVVPFSALRWSTITTRVLTYELQFVRIGGSTIGIYGLAGQRWTTVDAEAALLIAAKL